MSKRLKRPWWFSSLLGKPWLSGLHGERGQWYGHDDVCDVIGNRIYCPEQLMKTPPAPSTNPPIQKLLLDVSDVCQGANLSRQMLYKLWARGEGPKRIKLGSRTLVRAADLASWVQSLPAEEVSA